MRRPGWLNYFRLAQVKGIFEELDGWIRRKLRCVIWLQWKRTRKRAKGLIMRGLAEAQAWKSATNGRGPWWNAGASHMHIFFPKSYFDRFGLFSPADETAQLPADFMNRREPYVRRCGRTSEAIPPLTR